MKKQCLSLTFLGLCFTQTVFAASSPANPIERPLTLAEGETVISGGLLYGKQENGDNEWGVDFGLGYGITENLSLDFSGLRYRFLARENNKTGLELTVGAGYHGELESDMFGDAHGYGADLAGKYVFSSDVAMLFSVGYTRWDEDRRDDRDEIHYTLGLQERIFDSVTLSASYTYRDLDDFNQDNAYAWYVGAEYNLMKNLDVGMYYGKTDFDFDLNGYDADEHYRKGLGAYVTYRF